MQFLYNAEFDFELRNAQLSPQIITAVEAMAPLFSVALAGNDTILSQSHGDTQFDTYLNQFGIEHASLIPFSQATPQKQTEAWGWSSSAVTAIESINGKFYAPTPEICRVVNSREFAHNFNTEKGFGVPYSQIINTPCELRESLQNDRFNSYVLKPFFGNSGAGFLFISSDSSTEEIQKAELLVQNEPVILEPWLTRTSDIASLFRIDTAGNTKIIGHHLNICNASGSFYGTMICTNSSAIERWRDQIETMIVNVSQSLFSAGYFGLVSVDSISYADNDGEKIALCVDINCRYTMSYIAHMLYKKLNVSALFYRFIARKRHRLPETFAEFISQLGEIHYSKETKRGAFLASPLRLTGSDGVIRQPLRSAFCIVGESEDDLLEQDEILRQRVLRTKQ